MRVLIFILDLLRGVMNNWISLVLKTFKMQSNSDQDHCVVLWDGTVAM